MLFIIRGQAGDMILFPPSLIGCLCRFILIGAAISGGASHADYWHFISTNKLVWRLAGSNADVAKPMSGGGRASDIDNAVMTPAEIAFVLVS